MQIGDAVVLMAVPLIGVSAPSWNQLANEMEMVAEGGELQWMAPCVGQGLVFRRETPRLLAWLDGSASPRFICSWLRAAGCGLGWSTRWCSPAAARIVVSPRNTNSKSLWRQTCTAGSVLWYKHSDAEQNDALGPDGPFSPVCLGLHVLLRFLILQMDLGGDALGCRLWYRFGSAQPQQLRHSPTTVTWFCASPQAPK